MPRAKKSKARKVRPRLDKSININIKNVMKQLQNEPPRDFIRFVKDPKRELNFGSTTRAYNPPATYASNPLSAFPSLASVQNAPPIADQLKSQPAVYRPDVIQTETNPFDIVPSRLAAREIPSSAIPAPTSGGISAGASSRADFASPINMGVRPSVSLLEAFPEQDDSELLVSQMMDQDVRNYEREGRQRGRSPSVARTGVARDEDFLTEDQSREVVRRQNISESKRLTPARREVSLVSPSPARNKSTSDGLFRGGQVKSRMG